MKKTFQSIMTLGIVSLLIVSCEKEKMTETIVPAGFKAVEYSVSAETTKTSLSGEGADKTVNWVKGDEISIFYEGGSTTATANSSGPSTTFSAVVPEKAVCHAVYPSVAGVYADNAFSITIPAAQDGAFAKGNMSVALLNESGTSTFYNVTSFVKVVVKDADYTKVVLKAVGGENIAGKLAVTLDGGPVIGEVTEGASEITLSVAQPDTYYVAIVPGVKFAKGILITYYKGETEAGSYFLDADITIERAKIASVDAAEERIGDYYVSTTGAGSKSGKNEKNAMGPAALKALLNAVDDNKKPAQAAALNGTTIHLAAGTYDFGDIVTMSYGMDVEITFLGAEEATSVITGNDEHRLLIVGSGVKVSFDNIEFSHSLTPKSGEPAMLFNKGSELTLTNCKILNNINKDTGGAYHSQASIVANGKAYVENCEFAGNAASYSASLTLNADATVKNCKFHNNSGVGGPGNSLYMDADCTVNVEGCEFKDNTTSGKDGGAVSLSNGTLTMKDCSFVNNSNDKQASAIYAWNSAKVILTNCTMTGNHGSYGGAIKLDNTSELTIVGGTYSGNYAKGGGLVNQSGDSKVTIKENAVIKENYATGGHGGAILMGSSKGSLTCENVSFEGNYNNTSSGAWGGAIGTTENGTLTVKNCTFTGNHCKYLGGPAINLQNSISGSISGCTFTGNYSDCTDIADDNGNGNYGGGAMRLNSKGAVTIDNCYFEGNHLVKSQAYNHAYGGAVYINTAGTYKFNGCKFKDNYAVRGGALCAWATDAVIYLNGCGFDGNYISHRYGTTIHIEKAGSFCMNNCSINDNTYTLYGTGEWQAAWLNLSTFNSICISNCSFIGSPRTGTSKTVVTDKGAIIRFDTEVTDNNYFVNNIVVTEAAAGVNKSFANYNKANTAYFTKRSDNSANDAGGKYTMVESPGSNGFDNTMFSGKAWDSTNMCWTWNGTMTGGNNTNTSDVATAASYINKIPAFKTCPENIGALYKDQLGNARPESGNWWPGSYQNAN